MPATLENMNIDGQLRSLKYVAYLFLPTGARRDTCIMNNTNDVRCTQRS